MKWFIKITLMVIITLLATGYVSKTFDYQHSEVIIGVSVLIMIFVLMPSFLYHRYKNRKLQDYMLDKDKMNQIVKNLKDNGL